MWQPCDSTLPPPFTGSLAQKSDGQWSSITCAIVSVGLVRNCFAATTAGKKRSLKPDAAITPLRSTAATMRSQSASVSASGFSRKKFFPAAAAASASGACVSCCVQIHTASMSGSAQIFATSAVA